MSNELWNKREVMAYFHVRSWNTIWLWCRDRGFPLGNSYAHGGPILFDVAAVKKWAKAHQRPQYVKGRSTGKRPKFNLSQKEPADAAA